MNKERLQNLCAGLPVGVLVSIAVGFVSLIGITMTLVTYSELPAEETWRANTVHQRIIIDAKTGAVSGLIESTGNEFDVGDDTTGAAHETGEEAHTAPAKPVALSGDLPQLRTTPEVTEMPTVERGPQSLVKAPAPEAVETFGEFTLPRKTAKGLTPSRLYSRNFTRGEGQRLMAVVVTDIGFSNDALKAALDLPKEVTVALSPYAANLATQIETLRNAGHETWVMLPTTTDAYPRDDPGPLGLLGDQPADAVIGRLHQILASSPGAVGLVLSPDEAITQHENAWKVAFTEIDGRGLLFLTTRADRNLDQVVADKKKQEALVRRADIIIDSTPATAFIRSKIASLTGPPFSESTSDIIVVASARAQTLSILSDWLSTQRDYTVAPLSAVYRSYEAPPEAAPKKSGGHGGGH